MFFKTTKTPTGDTKEIQIVKTWIVEWWTKGEMYNEKDYHAEVFIDENVAEDFVKKIKESISFCRQRYCRVNDPKENNQR